jgi:hypothetical protein
MRDLKILLKKLINKLLERVKLFLLLSITIIAICGGVWGLYTTIMEGGLNILIFITSCVGVWFGIGMIDMFNNLNK